MGVAHAPGSNALDYTQITFEKRGRAGLITLNRPEKLNAWTPTMSAEMHDAMEQCRDDREVAAIIVTGAGRAFCSGADIREVFQANAEAQDKGDTRATPRLTVNWVEYVQNYPKPTIAAINGAAVGIGVTMILPFDIRIASTAARIGMFFVRMGLVPELGSSAILPQMVGSARALEWCLTGRMIPADEALAATLVTEVTEPGVLLDRALATAGQLAGNSAMSMTLIRKLLRENGTSSDIAAVMASEGAAIRAAYSSWEHREAIAAFMEKREADYTRQEPTRVE